MASTINGTSTGSGGLISTGDDSGILNIQTNETTAVAIDASQIVSYTNNLGTVAGYPAYQCRAWVNFNGTGTPAIRASGNVTSITDNGTGDYTINFTTAMPDANYCFTIGYRGISNNDTDYTPALYTGSDPTTSAIRFVTNNMSVGSLTGINTVCVAVFR